MNPPPSTGGDVTRRLLTAAEYFLRSRNFKDCRSYTLRARDSDSTRPEPDRILSIVSVLSVPNIALDLPDYYTILDVPHFESNAERIWSNFKTLDSKLNPNANSYSFAAEAHSLVMKAWAVLSNPTERAAFDAEVRGDSVGCTSGSRSSTFWTICPYCYFVYEFDRCFEDCCLRCTNEKCRRTLHAVELSVPPPPPAVLEMGRYYCPGFVRFGSGDSSEKSIWNPFIEFGVKIENGSEYTKERKRRRKTQSKNLTGRGGVNVDMNRSNSMPSVGIEDKGSEPRVGGETRNDSAPEVEFFEGDGDVLVGLQSIF